ncbi:hypothetical protein [Nostoc sp.]|uniref:hypothetical protein n=1 Tax=Nostoc sp. TaxID=1180 RepID=UPI003FA553CD
MTAPQSKGVAINTDSQLETEADVMGAKAARGESAQVTGAANSGVQRMFAQGNVIHIQCVREGKQRDDQSSGKEEDNSAYLADWAEIDAEIDRVMEEYYTGILDEEISQAVPVPGAVDGQDTLVLGQFLRDVVKLNQRNFRIFGPDETLSNLLGAVFEVTNRQWKAREEKNDEFLAPTGQVLDSMLSEHQCQGWLEGYLLTGRHGLFNSYEAFIRIVDSMFSQHAKWLKVTSELPWRRKIASLNYIDS